MILTDIEGFSEAKRDENLDAIRVTIKGRDLPIKNWNMIQTIVRSKV